MVCIGRKRNEGTVGLLLCLSDRVVGEILSEVAVLRIPGAYDFVSSASSSSLSNLLGRY